MARAEMRRNIDDLGRVVIPMEMRRALGLRPRDPVIIRPTETGVEIVPERDPEPKVAELDSLLADFLATHPHGTPAEFVVFARERKAAA